MVDEDMIPIERPAAHRQKRQTNTRRQETNTRRETKRKGRNETEYGIAGMYLLKVVSPLLKPNEPI